jgi:NAD(P)-dependent dehydrogenase (short-subunit alcohol dehydrogenase family)
VIYSAALAAFDDLLTVSPEQLAQAYAVDVIGAVMTAQIAAPAMRVSGGGTLLFTGGGFADALPPTLATLSLGKVALRAAATMLARELPDDAIHAGRLTIRADRRRDAVRSGPDRRCLLDDLQRGSRRGARSTASTARPDPLAIRLDFPGGKVYAHFPTWKVSSHGIAGNPQ